jgi:hypothetical protein
MLASAAYTAGQITGIVLVVTIAGFAVRDQLRNRTGSPMSPSPHRETRTLPLAAMQGSPWGIPEVPVSATRSRR